MISMPKTVRQKKNTNTAKGQGKADNAMNIKLIEKIAEAIKSVSELCKKALDASDPEKLAGGVEALHKGVSDTYDQMRQVIITSEKFTEDEKLERLAKLAKQEEESKEKCVEAIKKNREQVASITLSIAKGLFTCGIAYVPEIVKALSAGGVKHLPKNKEPLLIEEEASENRESL